MARTKVMPSADDLPEIRYEAISHLLRVFSISRQIVREELLLVEDSPDQHWYGESKNRESPPGAEREWDAYDHDQDSHVHRMPNASVETGRDDFLVFKGLDRRSSVAIFSEHEVER